MRDLQYQDALHGLQKDFVRELRIQQADTQEANEDTAFSIAARDHSLSHHATATTSYYRTSFNLYTGTVDFTASTDFFQAGEEQVLVGAWCTSVSKPDVRTAARLRLG
jgi:hypothetical protein